MAIQVYNTLARAKQEFIPISGKRVNMFVCGPTVYDYSHLGHAKTYIQFDLIARYLRHRGYEVFYLQNLTDIDDKIIRKANGEGRKPSDVAREFEQAYLEDMKALGNSAVDRLARATDYIPQIVSQVKTLISKGFAYRISDGYYFDLSRFEDYGKLSGRQTLQENDSVSRVDENAQKRNRGDFCLWKFHKEGEPFWETELGKGRPGWHIEDTAISEAHFGQQYDLHGGAVDLIFPHHEAEVAQQEAASGKKPFVRYWLHTAFLNINSEKMSKSKGNFLTVREALKQYDARAIRFFFISNHYRTPLDMTPEIFDQATNSLKRLDDFAASIIREADDGHSDAIEAFKERFYSHLDDDFDTPKAFAELFDLIRDLNSKGKLGKTVWQLLEEISSFTGLFDLSEVSLDSEAEALLSQREQARKAKDFKKADAIRDQLKEKGYVIEDTKEGARIKKAL